LPNGHEQADPGFDLVERARALRRLIAREADEIERTRRLTPPVVSALIENGLYRALLPKSLGGAKRRRKSSCRCWRRSPRPMPPPPGASASAASAP
jgi:alkylation response protein AidB-like acyl-CoA dehydrogenase